MYSNTFPRKVNNTKYTTNIQKRWEVYNVDLFIHKYT